VAGEPEVTLVTAENVHTLINKFNQ